MHDASHRSHSIALIISFDMKQYFRSDYFQSDNVLNVPAS